MRNGIIGGMLGVFLGAGVLVFMTMACGGAGGGGGTQLVIGESVLAAAQIDGHGTTPVVNRFINHLGPTVTVTRDSTGRYDVDFGFDVSERYFAITIGRASIGGLNSALTLACVPKFGNPNVVTVGLANPHLASFTDDSYFYIAVF